MAVYTELTATDIKKIAVIFGLPDITSVSNFAGGQENSNYHLIAGETEYVLTLCENKTPAEVQTLVDTLHHLEAHSFQTTRIITTREGATQAELHHKPLLLKSYLPGTVIDPLPLATMEPLGQAMARLHQVPVPDFLPNRLAYGRETFSPMRQNFDGPHPFLNWLEKIETYLNNHFPENLPKALIHADIFADNVILTPDQGPMILVEKLTSSPERIYCMVIIR